MKNFTYTARDKSGAMLKGNLTADDRTAVLQALRVQGLAPVSVVEGPAPKESFRLNIAPRTLVLAGVTLLLVVGALFMLPARKPEKPHPKPEVKKAVKVAKAKPVPAPQKALEQPKVPVETPNPVEVAAPPPAELRGVVPPKVSKALRVPPKSERIISFGLLNVNTNVPNPLATFQTKTERMMSLMLSAKPGELILDVSLGRDFDKDFAASLDNTIEIYPSDTPEMAAHKEDVAWMKDEMRKLVKAGQSPEQLLTEYRNQHNEVANFRSELQRELSALKQEGKVEEAEAFVKEANKMLEPYGTKPLTAYSLAPIKKQQH